jgi:hypothetical protein
MKQPLPVAPGQHVESARIAPAALSDQVKVGHRAGVSVTCHRANCELRSQRFAALSF